MFDKKSWFGKLKNSLAKTQDNFGKKILQVFGKGKIDDDIYKQLEETLITADVGVHTTRKILQHLQDTVTLKKLTDKEELLLELQNVLQNILKPLESKLDFTTRKPYVIMMVGINGAGKTTSIGKLTKYLQQHGQKVLLAAGDTFRAAAREQLVVWGERNGVEVLATPNIPPAALAFDAVKKGQQENFDVVIIDTAGRLPSQQNLMAEVEKIKKVIQKADQSAPDEILLVLDASIGQNAISQAEKFHECLGLTGLIVTKLDGTAKGGIVCALADKNIPIKFIGTGEQLDDLQEFNSENYVSALLSNSSPR
jgi:fused signal recognition particle receptor